METQKQPSFITFNIRIKTYYPLRSGKNKLPRPIGKYSDALFLPVGKCTKYAPKKALIESTQCRVHFFQLEYTDGKINTLHWYVHREYGPNRENWSKCVRVVLVDGMNAFYDNSKYNFQDKYFYQHMKLLSGEQSHCDRQLQKPK